MTRPTIVLDANAFSSKGFRVWLALYPGKKVLPIVAYVEIGVHQEAKGKLQHFRAYLVQSGIEIEWMRLPEADRTIQEATPPGRFAESARDFLIASHVHGERVLVTHNTRDFIFLKTVVTPEAAMERFS